MIVYEDVLFMKRRVKKFFLFYTSRLTFKLKHLSNFPFYVGFTRFVLAISILHQNYFILDLNVRINMSTSHSFVLY